MIDLSIKANGFFPMFDRVLFQCLLNLHALLMNNFDYKACCSITIPRTVKAIPKRMNVMKANKWL